jgi:hypothetical protein
VYELCDQAMKDISLSALCVLLLCPSVIASPQEATPSANDRVAWAQAFLRGLYPGLKEKKLISTVETAVPFDERSPPISWLTLYVGEGFKYWLMGYHGCLTEPPVREGALPGPEPPVSSTAPPAPQTPSEQLPDVCKPGPMYPKQFLTAGFQFDKDGRLATFGADGPFINDRKADNEAYAIVGAHPQMTYAEVVATLKQHGTKYGPGDRDQLARDLPLKQLEPFLGKLQIDSIDFPHMDEDHNPVPWVDRWLAPDWTVKAHVTTKDGAKVAYELKFSHLNGYLTGLLNCQASPWCNRD